MTIEVKENMTPTALMNDVWRRIQQPILRHFEKLSAKSTTYLPQSIAIEGPYDDKIRGIPTVKFDLSQEDFRPQTQLIIYDNEGEYVSAQTFQDGQLVRSQGGQ